MLWIVPSEEILRHPLNAEIRHDWVPAIKLVPAL